MQCTIEEILATTGKIAYKVEGKSMEPMLIPNKDIIRIKSAHNVTIAENDVVLYSKNNKLILHRVISISPNGRYTLLGDNCSMKEYDITRSDIIGILEGFVHNGQIYDMDDPIYLSYVKRLRNNEDSRIKKKYIIDTLSWELRFLPARVLSRIKCIAKRLLKYNSDFEK